MSPLNLQQLRLHNFRSYRELTWQCQPGLNIIQGPNAAGKTNLLEAIGYLSFARSFRQQQDQHLVTWGEKVFQIKGLCNDSQGKLEIDIIYRHSHKELTINHQRHRLIDLLGVLPVIYFAPDDLLLLKGGPFYRRQFLDREISILDRFYCQKLQLYRHLLCQRNRLLRLLKDGRGKEQELEPWNIQLIDTGLAIIKRRQAFIKAVDSLAAVIYQALDERKNLRLVYRPCTGERDEWLALLAAGQEKEIAAGQSLWGPHRDDFSINIDGHEARFFASQGQQRSAVLAVKIAEARIFKQILGKNPVLLLDDVFSELDIRRQQSLLELLASTDQTFLTTTAITQIPAGLLEQATIWQITGDRGLAVYRQGK